MLLDWAGWNDLLNLLRSVPFWSVLLDWVVVFIGILGVGIALGGFPNGIVGAYHNVFVLREETVKKIRLCTSVIWHICFYSVVGGILVLILAFQGKVKEDYINLGFLIGGVIGCIISLLFAKWEKEDIDALGKKLSYVFAVVVWGASISVAIGAIAGHVTVIGDIVGYIIAVIVVGVVLIVSMDLGMCVANIVGDIISRIICLIVRVVFAIPVRVVAVFVPRILEIFSKIIFAIRGLVWFVVVFVCAVIGAIIGIYIGAHIGAIIGIYIGVIIRWVVDVIIKVVETLDFLGLIVAAIVWIVATRVAVFVATCVATRVIGIVPPAIISYFEEFFAEPLTKILALFTRHVVVCEKCLRYSEPFESKYEMGNRYCEHCGTMLEQTTERGKVICVFGNYNVAGGNRVFIRKNFDFSNEKEPIDVSEVYIDTKTADILLLRHFMTYIRNHPPKYGRKSITIFYKGNLDDLGGNLRNIITNEFSEIKNTSLL